MTREDTSKLLVALTGALVFAGASLFAGMEHAPARATVPGGTATGEVAAGTGSPAPAAEPAADTVPAAGDSATIAQGRKLFRSVGCTGCHGAEGVGSRRLLLDGVGSRLSADTLRAWIVAPRSVDPGVRKPAYDYLPAEEVEALVAYMLSLEEGG